MSGIQMQLFGAMGMPQASVVRVMKRFRRERVRVTPRIGSEESRWVEVLNEVSYEHWLQWHAVLNGLEVGE